MTPSGAVPTDNPYDNLVFAFGFRNVFGFDFDPATGRLWAADNGPKGAAPTPSPLGQGRWGAATTS